VLRGGDQVRFAVPPVCGHAGQSRECRSLAAAIEESIENQPHCESVTVDVLTDELASELADGPADYTELTGRFMNVEIVVDYGGYEVVARMAMDEGYPLMDVVSVSE
jgi:hypothetical protein